MLRARTVLLMLAVVAGAAAGASTASAVTAGQLTSKCRAVWTGPVPSTAYTAFRTRCVRAGGNAVDAATDAGNPRVASANRTRAQSACARQYPAPRSAARQRLYNLCVSAAIQSQLAYAPRALTFNLTGANEVPPAGADRARASIRLNSDRSRVCYTLTPLAAFSSPVVGAHIHQGTAGVNGPVVVGLSTLGNLTAGRAVSGCERNVDRALILRIRRNPAGFYVNIHTQGFPGGAARGQLR